LNRYYPQIKVCGLTRPDQARACADLGADAIGLVFYGKSPRNVTLKQAAAIRAALPPGVSAVGVFVNPSREALVQSVDRCGLDIIQLHGTETPDVVTGLHADLNVPIIKALFTTRPPGLTDAGNYDAAGYLVECGQGPLPGGNAMGWDWSLAEEFARHYPLILAGGLGPDNVVQAIGACLPDAVDASSKLEAEPGVKDLEKVAGFIARVKQTEPLYKGRKRIIRPILSSLE
jgi:phosphoribosylanthranilate isomerase